GAVQALAFVGPLLYFVFIILSTLRLDFWLSAFTGFVAGVELLRLALFHPAAQTAASGPTLAVPFVMSRSAVIFACRVIAGARGEPAGVAVRSAPRRPYPARSGNQPIWTARVAASRAAAARGGPYGRHRYPARSRDVR